MFIGQLIDVTRPSANGTASATTEQQRLRLAFAGGGTGGHLAPALALIEELVARIPSSQLVAFTTGRPVEKAMLAEAPVRTVEIAAAAPQRSLKQAVHFARQTLAGTRQALAELRDSRPHAVLAMGGYTALAPVLAARMLRIPVVLFEQNLVAGRAVRFLSRWAQACISQWPLPDWSLHPRCEQIVRGNPVRRSVLAGESRLDALKRLGLSPRRKTLLLMGGSQGASAINGWLCDHARLIAEYAPHAQVIALTGTRDYDDVTQRLASVPNVCVQPFARDMGGLYAAADLVVGRAGATSIAECTALGKPMALIPYPHATDGHQLKNALYCARAEAALVFDEQHLDRDTWRVLFDSILLNDWQRYAMADASAQLGRPQAALHALRAVVSRLESPVRAEEALPNPRISTVKLREIEALWREEATLAMAETPAGHPAESLTSIDRLAA